MPVLAVRPIRLVCQESSTTTAEERKAVAASVVYACASANYVVHCIVCPVHIILMERDEHALRIPNDGG